MSHPFVPDYSIGPELETARLILLPPAVLDFDAYAAYMADERVAQRLGSTLRGPGKFPVPYEDHPMEIWGQTREEWMRRRHV